MMRQIRMCQVLVLVLAVARMAMAQGGDEAAGQRAEQAGDLRGALTYYVVALQAVPDLSPDDQRLRERIIRVALRLDPRPALPDAVISYLGRAQAAVKLAKTPADYNDAANEYKKALRVAPWEARFYYDLAKILERAERPAEAIRNYELYLLAAPQADDVTDVKIAIAGLGYVMEKADQARTLAAAKADQDRRRQEAVEEARRRLEGLWACADCNPGISYEYRLTINGNDVRIYQTEWCVRGQCGRTNRQTFRGSLRDDGSIRGSVIVESSPGGQPPAGEYAATARVSPNYDEITFIVQAPAAHASIRKR